MNPSEKLDAIAIRFARDGHLSAAADLAALAHEVRRIETALDEIVADAMEDDELRRSAAMVRRGRFGVIDGGLGRR